MLYSKGLFSLTPNSTILEEFGLRGRGFYPFPINFGRFLEKGRAILLGKHLFPKVAYTKVLASLISTFISGDFSHTLFGGFLFTFWGTQGGILGAPQILNAGKRVENFTSFLSPQIFIGAPTI